MKHLFILLVYIPIITYSQDRFQQHNGINLGAPKEYIKTGDFIWKKKDNQDNIIMIQAVQYPYELSDTELKNFVEQESSGTKHFKTEEIEMNGIKNYVGLHYGDNGKIIGMMTINKNGYNYTFVTAILLGAVGNGMPGSQCENPVLCAAEEIFYIFGYQTNLLFFQ